MCLRIIDLLIKSKKDNESYNDSDINQTIDNETVVNDITQEKEKIEEMNKPYYPNVIVCLDNGHAKDTSGKRSPYSGFGTPPSLDFYEYKFNRIIVNKIAEKLKNYGIEPFIVTPETDKDVALTTRYKRANNKKSQNPDKKCLFISVHANACGDGTVWNSGNGWSCYTTKGQNNSDKFADCLYDAATAILPVFGRKIRTDMSDGDRDYEENFTVIYGANMPAVLTENLFFTNIEDTKFLLSEEGQETIADIHVNGILRYCEKYF